jgi:ATP-dependent exoDNAse (exonuclease V) beta subunit
LDDINLLYVAFTRAKKVLIAGIEQQLIGKELSKLIETNFKIENVNKNIDSYKTFENENVTIFEFGELKGKDEPYAEIESEHYEIKPNSKPQSLRLVVKGNEEWSSQKSIAHGVLIHAIMEQITDIINWEQVAQRVMITFNVAVTDKKKIKKKI